VAFFVGLGVDQDYFEARRWFEEAAEQGCAVAKSWLGEMLWNRWGGKENKMRAEELWRESVEEVEERALVGDVLAQHRLGKCYLHGRGTLQNNVEAHRWDHAAASCTRQLSSTSLVIMQTWIAEVWRKGRKRLSSGGI
jgi:TPR repeat protein